MSVVAADPMAERNILGPPTRLASHSRCCCADATRRYRARPDTLRRSGRLRRTVCPAVLSDRLRDRPIYAAVAEICARRGCLGRDVLSRVLSGGVVLLPMAVAATVLGVGFGAVAGMSAGYLRGRSDGIIMRTVDCDTCVSADSFLRSCY